MNNTITERKPWSLLAHIGGKCPACGSENIQKRAENEATKYYCTNPTCGAQLGARIEYMAGRARLDLDQLGTEACDEIGFRAFLEGVEHQFDILNMPVGWFANLSWKTETGGKMTFGESRAKKVTASIQKAKTAGLNRWVASLGVPSVGDNTSKEISRLFADAPTLARACTHPEGILKQMHESLQGDKKLYEEMKERYGISHHLGPVSLTALVEFVRDNGEIVARIPVTAKSDNYAPDPPEEVTGPLVGKKFVITGTLSVPRSAVKHDIEQAGGKVSGSISKSTDVLVAGEKAGGKMTKAEKLGVTVWSEADLKERLG